MRSKSVRMDKSKLVDMKPKAGGGANMPPMLASLFKKKPAND